MSIADTNPPSWPILCTMSSVARVSSSWRQMPAISSGSRTRPNRCMSAAGSHARKRGQARVQVVQPLRRTVDAVVEAELLLEVERDVLALLVLVADDVVGAGDDAAGAAGAQAGRDDLGVELLPLRRPALGLGGWDQGGVRFDSRHAWTVRDRARRGLCVAARRIGRPHARQLRRVLEGDGTWAWGGATAGHRR